MQILLDTHVFLWLRHDPKRISEKVLSAYYDTNNNIFLSMASIWEMQIKYQLGKLELKLPVAALIEEQVLNNDLHILPIETEHVFALANLPFHHKDPFDRIILIQSQLENLKLASVDIVFSHYNANLFW